MFPEIHPGEHEKEQADLKINNRYEYREKPVMIQCPADSMSEILLSTSRKPEWMD